MFVVLEKQAAKYLKRLNEPIKGRIIRALQSLVQDRPVVTKSFTRTGWVSAEVGGYIVTNIAPRGQAYK
jgi:hypothetical protein